MANTNNKLVREKIILASASPRRSKLLKLIGLNLKCIKSNIDEDLLLKNFRKATPEKLVKVLSLAKAISVLAKLKKEEEVIAAFDTIVFCKNRIMGKPKNKIDALKKILFLSNKEHRVITGIAILNTGKKTILLDYEITKVRMKKISKEEAISYIKTKEPFDKAGGYAIQGRGSRFVKSISGDYFNVVGLPLKKFLLNLKSLL